MRDLKNAPAGATAGVCQRTAPKKAVKRGDVVSGRLVPIGKHSKRGVEDVTEHRLCDLPFCDCKAVQRIRYRGDYYYRCARHAPGMITMIGGYSRWKVVPIHG